MCGQQEIPSRVIPSYLLRDEDKKNYEECDNKDIIRGSYLFTVKLKLPFSNFWDVVMELSGLYYLMELHAMEFLVVHTQCFPK